MDKNTLEEKNISAKDLPGIIIRKAKISDVEKIFELIDYYAKDGLMLSKNMSYIYEHLRQYLVAEEGGELLGVGALRIFWSDLAEVCSIAVSPRHQKKGIGKAIVTKLEEEARDLGLSKVFALTYQEEFFLNCDYQRIDKDLLPQKIWQDCLNCPKYDYCDEIAVIKTL